MHSCSTAQHASWLLYITHHGCCMTAHIIKLITSGHGLHTACAAATLFVLSEWHMFSVVDQ
jgi:hypothetical protein